MLIFKSKLRKIGNSQGVLISSELLQLAKLKPGSEIDIIVEEGVIYISPPAPTLKELVKTVKKARFDKMLPTGKAVGKEKL